MPRRTEELFVLAADCQIQVLWRRLLPGRAGLYVPPSDKPAAIILDPWLERRERWLRATLAHELGHHVTVTAGWLRLAMHSAQVQRQVEAKAQRWALEYLMPAQEFAAAARQGLTVHDMADWFLVPESWVEQRARLLAADGGVFHVKLGDGTWSAGDIVRRRQYSDSGA